MRLLEPKTTPAIICVMYDATSSEDKSSDELECFAVTAALVRPAKLLELTRGITPVSNFKMGFNLIEQTRFMAVKRGTRQP